MTFGPNPDAVVIFNCYGTLLHFKSFGAFAMMAESLVPDRDPGQVSWSVMTLPIAPELVVNLLGGDSSRPEMALFRRLLDRELTDIRLFPDTLAALRVLQERKIRIGVYGNASQPFVAPAVKLLSPYVEAFSWSSDVGTLMPDRLVLEDILGQMKVEPAKAVLVSDVSQDVECARDLGMSALHLNRDGHQTADETSLTSLHAVLPALERTTRTAQVKEWWPTEEELRRFAARKRKSVHRTGAHARR